METNLRDALTEQFVQLPIAHGVFFDDGRRWCAICKTPRLFCHATESTRKWSDMVCQRCSAVWPEYEDTILNEVDTDDIESWSFSLPH